MSEAPRYQIIALDASVHDRANFDCGELPLNRYLREQASQDIRRKAAGCWVLFSRDRPDHVLGFYTLSTEAVDMKALGDVEPQVVKQLPRYPRLGAVLLGRLAVTKSAQKQSLGELPDDGSSGSRVCRHTAPALTRGWAIAIVGT